MGNPSFDRLEDFIVLSQQGEDVEVFIDLKKQIVVPKVGRGGPGDAPVESELYVLLAEYTFSHGGTARKVSKPYMYGISEESVNMSLREIQIANERLKMDYSRLKEAGIIFEERYFASS